MRLSLGEGGGIGIGSGSQGTHASGVTSTRSSGARLRPGVSSKHYEISKLSSSTIISLNFIFIFSNMLKFLLKSAFFLSFIGVSYFFPTPFSKPSKSAVA